MYVRTYVRMYVCVCVYVRVYIYICGYPERYTMVYHKNNIVTLLIDLVL